MRLSISVQNKHQFVFANLGINRARVGYSVKAFIFENGVMSEAYEDMPRRVIIYDMGHSVRALRSFQGSFSEKAFRKWGHYR